MTCAGEGWGGRERTGSTLPALVRRCREEEEMAPHSALLPRRLPIGLIAVSVTLVVGGIASGAPVPTCFVVNQTQHKHFPPDVGPSLAAALAGASTGDELTVTGTCTGTYTVES